MPGAAFILIRGNGQDIDWRKMDPMKEVLDILNANILTNERELMRGDF